MALTLSTSINSDLTGFLESSLVAAATSAFAANPVAARLILTNALIALFSPELAAIVAVACAAAAAAYLLDRFGADSTPPPAASYTSNNGIWKITQTGVDESGAAVVTNFVRTCSGSSRWMSVGAFYRVGPRNISPYFGDYYNVNVTYASGVSEALYGTTGAPTQAGKLPTWSNAQACAGTGNTVTASGGGYPTLDASAEKAIKALTIPTLNPAPDLTPVLNGQATTNQKVDTCCTTTQNNFGDVINTLNTSVSTNQSTYSDLLARIKKISQNIGLPDIDGGNTGVIYGPYTATSKGTLGSAIDALWKALGAFDSNNSVTLAGTASVAASLLSYTKILDQRIGYFAQVDINVGPQLNLQITNVQTHIQQLDVGLPEPTYSLGYPGTEAPQTVLKVTYTNRAQYTYRQQGTITIVNPKADITEAQIKSLIGTKTAGAYWCSIACADNTKIAGWFQSASDGQNWLTNACALQDSGFKVPLEFDATLKTRGIPVLRDILVTATSYVHTKLSNTGNYVTTRKRINLS